MYEGEVFCIWTWLGFLGEFYMALLHKDLRNEPFIYGTVDYFTVFFPPLTKDHNS